MNRDYERRRDLLLLHADSPPPWTPAAIPGTLLWLGTPGLVYAPQPTLVDGDMEAAGVAAWLDNLSTMSKQGDPYAGLQCLRVTNAGGANRWAYQNVGGITGNRYRITGAARGDGQSYPRIALGGDSVEWRGAASNAWQVIAGDYKFTSGSNLYLFAWGADGGYCEFDSLTLQQLSLQRLTPQYVAPAYAGTWLAQATPAAQPWWDDALKAARYQGGDLAAWTAAASAAKCLHDGSGATINICVRASALAAENRIFATADSAVGNVGVVLYYTNANTVGIRVMNGGAAFDIDTAAACNVAINTTYVFTLKIAAGANGVEVLCDNVSKLTATLTAPSAADPTTGLMIGASAAGSASSLDGAVRDFHFANRVLTPAENAQLVADMKLRCP